MWSVILFLSKCLQNFFMRSYWLRSLILARFIWYMLLLSGLFMCNDSFGACLLLWLWNGLGCLGRYRVTVVNCVFCVFCGFYGLFLFDVSLVAILVCCNCCSVLVCCDCYEMILFALTVMKWSCLLWFIWCVLVYFAVVPFECSFSVNCGSYEAVLFTVVHMEWSCFLLRL